jgi:lipid II isoglutaminyl synthase (glutamine-hydrolysing)
MKNYFLIILLTIISLQTHAQRIRFDIFDNLEYESRENRYKAYLKKDIFNNLLFSDNQANELTFMKKYLDLTYSNSLEDEEDKIDFFRNLIDTYGFESGYKATYTVDILDKVIIEDNRNSRIEIGRDIFGNATYDERTNNIRTTIRRDLFGNLEFRSGRDQANLKKDIFNRWRYTDSSGNDFRFSTSSWDKLLHLYISEEDVLYFLVDKFLYY